MQIRRFVLSKHGNGRSDGFATEGIHLPAELTNLHGNIVATVPDGTGGAAENGATATTSPNATFWEECKTGFAEVGPGR